MSKRRSKPLQLNVLYAQLCGSESRLMALEARLERGEVISKLSGVEETRRRLREIRLEVGRLGGDVEHGKRFAEKQRRDMQSVVDPVAGGRAQDVPRSVNEADSQRS